MRPIPGLTMAAAGIAMLASLPATAKEVTLSAVNFVPNTQAFGKPFAEWVEQVNQRHKGVLQINLRPSGSMSPFEMGNAVRNGVVDMAHVPTTFYQNLLPVGDALKLMTRSPAEQRKNGGWELLNRLHNEHVNAHYLMTWGFGVPFHVYLRDRKIDKANLGGMSLRVTPVYRAFFRALGANNVQMAPGEVFTALQRGTIDGYGWPLWDIRTVGWDKHTKYRVDPGFYNVSVSITINLDRWKSLTDAQRDILTKEGIRLREETEAATPEISKAYEKEQEEAGVEVIRLSEAEAEKFLKTAQEAGWAEIERLDPVNAPKLRALIAD